MLNLSSNVRFAFITLTWAPPADPNGIIIGYEINYTVTDGLSTPVHVMENVTRTMYTISDLAPETRVTVSVNAYTSAGRGTPSPINLTTHSICEFKYIAYNWLISVFST